MALFSKTLDDRFLLINAASSPGTGWAGLASFQTALNSARTANLQLYILPCTISTGAVDVNTTTGSGNRLQLSAAPGSVIIQLSGTATYLIKCDSIPDIAISGITFDGNNQSLTQTVGSVGAGLVRVTGTASTNAQISNCVITRSTQSGLLIDAGPVVTIVNSQITSCDIGITSLDSQTSIYTSRVVSSGDNGIIITRTNQTGDSSIINANFIQGVVNNNGGTGQYGNGILIYKAFGVRITDNTINNCNFSAIRINGAGNCQVLSNNIYNSREVAIYVEAPDPSFSTQGGVIANNVISTAGVGISVANLALYSDGYTRRITVTGNQIVNITQNTIPPPYGLSQTYGAGIIVTGYTTVTANTIESAATAGIILGTNNATADLTCTGNYVTQCPMGIGYSADPSAGNVVITGNLVTQFRSVAIPTGTGYNFSGAIVSAVYSGSTYNRGTNGSAANADYGNANDQQVGNLRVGNNRSA